MPRFEIDPRFPDHRKVRQLGARDRVAAVGLWTLAGAWSVGHNDAGFVPADIVAERWDSKLRLAGMLVAVELWHDTEEKGEAGYRFHDWGDWRPDGTDDDSDGGGEDTAAERRARDAARKRRDRAGARDGALVGAGTNGHGVMSAAASADASMDMSADASADSPRTPPLSSPPHPPISHPTDPYGVSARAAATAGAPTREAPPTDLAQRCVRSFTPRGVGRRDLHKLAQHVDDAIADGATWPAVEHALIAWSRRTECTPGLLPSLITDAVKAEHGGVAGRPANTRPSTTDAAVAAVEALRHPGNDTTSGLRAIQGGQTG